MGHEKYLFFSISVPHLPQLKEQSILVYSGTLGLSAICQPIIPSQHFETSSVNSTATEGFQAQSPEVGDILAFDFR